MRQLQLARLVAIGAGEAALHVAEQLGLEQRLGEPAQLTAMNGRAARARARVDLAGDEILADAALAGDEHLRVAGRHALHEREDVRHLLARADDDRRALVRRFPAARRNRSRHVAAHLTASTRLHARRAGFRCGRVTFDRTTWQTGCLARLAAKVCLSRTAPARSRADIAPGRRPCVSTEPERQTSGHRQTVDYSTVIALTVLACRHVRTAVAHGCRDQ